MKALVLWGVLGLLLLAGLGGGYYFYSQQQASTSVAANPPVTRTRPPVQPTSEATTAPAQPTAAATSAAPTAAETKVPTQDPPTREPTAAPTAARTSAPATTAGTGLGEARSLLRAGEFGSAAHAFASHLRRGGAGFTVQLMVACSEDTVKKAVTSVSQDELYIVPVDHKGRSCYKLGWGVYESEPRAASALKALPDYFRQPGVTPRVVTTATVLR